MLKRGLIAFAVITKRPQDLQRLAGIVLRRNKRARGATVGFALRRVENRRLE
jgi:hypothetical protein